MSKLKAPLGLSWLLLLAACVSVRPNPLEVPTLDRVEKIRLGDTAEAVAAIVGQPDVKLLFIEPAGTAWVYFRGSIRPGQDRLSVFFPQASERVSRIGWHPQGRDPENSPDQARKRFGAYQLVIRERILQVAVDTYERERTLADETRDFRIVYSSNLREIDSIIWETRASREWDAAHSKDDYPVRHKLAPGEKEKLFSAVDAAFPPDRTIGSTPQQ